jgi:peptidyl-prolyl cis-trans isomerase D
MSKEEEKIVSKKHIVRSMKEKEQQKKLIVGTIIITAVALLVILYGILDQYVLQDYKAVAVVNGEKITVKDFIEMTQYSRFQAKQQYNENSYIYQMFGEDASIASSFVSNMKQIYDNLNPLNSITYGQSIIDYLVSNKLLEQQAKEMGITVSEDEINAKLEEIFQYSEGTATPEPTATAFPTLLPTSTFSSEQLAMVTLTATPTEAPTATEMPATPTLAATATVVATEQSEPTVSVTPSMTPTEYTYEGYQSEYKNYMTTLSEYGISENFFRNLVRMELLSGKIQKAVTADVTPVQTEVWARHILVADKTVADVLYQRLTTENADFAELAKEASIDTANSSTGGDLGWFPRHSMVKAFDTAVFDNLKVGEISQPIETDFGFHIIQKLGQEERSLTDTEYESYLSTVYSSWQSDIKENSKIDSKDIWMNLVPTDITITLDEVPTSLQSSFAN